MSWSPSKTDPDAAGGRTATCRVDRPVRPSTATVVPVDGPDATWTRRPVAPAQPHRTTTGSHCSPVRPAIGQKATTTPAPTSTTAITTPPSDGRLRTDSTASTRATATAPTWPARHPAITPRRSSGGKR